jgi:hypothetical protein
MGNVDSRVTRYVALLAGNGAILLTAAQRGPQGIDYSELSSVYDLFGLGFLSLLGIALAYLALVVHEKRPRLAGFCELISALTFSALALLWLHSVSMF